MREIGTARGRRRPRRLRRTVVIGSTGSGKTSLAGAIAERLALPHVELDSLYWDADWTSAPDEIFRARAAEALAGDAWVVDGNYRRVRDIVWRRADTIVWLDYPLWLILWRLFWRTLRRSAKRELLWNGNRERWRQQFLSTESLFLWAIKNFRLRRREYPLLLQQPEHAHLTVYHFRRPGTAQHWLSRLPAVSAAGSCIDSP